MDTRIDAGGADAASPERLVRRAEARGDGWRHALETAFLAQGASRPPTDGPSEGERDATPLSRQGGHATSTDLCGDRPAAAGRAPGAAEASPERIRRPEGMPLPVRPGTAGTALLRLALDGKDGDIPPPPQPLPLSRPVLDAYARSMPAAREPGASAPAGADSPWLAANLFFERTAEGAVVWIRDAGAQQASLPLRVADILRQAEAAGVRIRGVRLNGKPLAFDGDLATILHRALGPGSTASAISNVTPRREHDGH
jgi:hypothetical protein